VSTAHIRSAECAVCQRHITLLRDGTFRPHGPRKRPCLGSQRMPEEVKRHILPPLTDEQMDMFRNCWRVGDWRPIELEFGIAWPQYHLRGRTPEEELADLIDDVRHWISTLFELSRSHAARRVP
jgi:hypothetical protein